jgi:hypothetical protein
MYNSAVALELGKIQMGRKEQSSEKDQGQPSHGTGVTLKAVSKHVGLTPGTVSAVLNKSTGMPDCVRAHEKADLRCSP